MNVRAQVSIPGQVHRLPHVQHRLQKHLDRSPGHRVHVVEQRRNQTGHRLSDPVGRQEKYKGGWERGFD
jgi:hypothetical protein